MLRKALLIAAALGATAMAAAALVVALAYALFAALVGPIGAPLASASVAGAAAVLIGLAALIASLKARPPRRKPAPVHESLTQTLMDAFKEKPFVAGGVAAAAAALALIKPEVIGVILRTLINVRGGPSSGAKGRRKG